MTGNKLYTFIATFVVFFVSCALLFNSNVKAVDKQAPPKISLEKCMEALNNEDKDASDRCRYCLKSLKKQSKEFKKLNKDKELSDADYTLLKTELDSKIKKVEELELKYNKAIGSILFEVPGADSRVNSAPTSGAQLYYVKNRMTQTKEKQDKMIKEKEDAETNQNNKK